MLTIDVNKFLPEFELDFFLDTRDQGTEVIILTGPSGAGKTTLLRCICGLDVPQKGYIAAKGKTFFDSNSKLNSSPAARGVGVCFQDYLLFPHLTAQENILYGLKKVNGKPHEKKCFDNLVGELGLNDRILSCYPGKLSGGEKQRVALARALMRGENLLLLDEPFNALDKDLRNHVAHFIREWIKTYQIPAVIVSHLEDEKTFCGDLEIRMEKGKYQQDQLSIGENVVDAV